MVVLTSILALVFLGGVIALLFLLVRRMRTTRWVNVFELVPVTVAAADIESCLAGIHGVRVQSAGPRQFAVVVRRSPVWVVVPVLLLFPIGLLFLLYRTDVSVEILVEPDARTATLRGRTEERVLEAVRLRLSSA